MNDIVSILLDLNLRAEVFYRLDLDAASAGLFRCSSLTIRTFTDVHLSLCTKPHCLSCSHTCEIFRSSSSTFKFLFHPGLSSCYCCMHPESVFVNYLFILVEIKLMKTGLTNTNCQGYGVKLYCDQQKSRFGSSRALKQAKISGKLNG